LTVGMLQFAVSAFLETKYMKKQRRAQESKPQSEPPTNKM